MTPEVSPSLTLAENCNQEIQFKGIQLELNVQREKADLHASLAWVKGLLALNVGAGFGAVGVPGLSEVEEYQVNRNSKASGNCTLAI